MDEVVLMESLSLRQKLCTDANTSILNKIGHLVTLPNNGWAIKENVAKFYQVSLGTLDSLIKRHLKELKEDGYKVLSRKEFENLHEASLEIPNRGLAIFPRRAILRIGMVLRDSVIAKQVRSYLLNIEEISEQRPLPYNNLNKMAIQLASQAIELGNHAKELELQAIQLTKQREEITENNLQLEENAMQLTRNAQQLIFQSSLIKAMVEEMYEGKHRLEKVETRVDEYGFKMDSYNKRLEALEQLTESNFEQQVNISREQEKLLKERVKAKGSKMNIWAIFKKHFQIKRYRDLPKNQFREALDWLEN